jgi:hypothetical protein
VLFRSIALIGTAETPQDCTVDRAQLKSELEGLRPSQLKQRAFAAGADRKTVDAADDASSPSEVLVALVIELETAAGDS